VRFSSTEKVEVVPMTSRKMDFSYKDRDDFVFWDTRSREEYEGSASAGYGTISRLGHLPGAAHLEWTELLDPETRTLKPANELR